ncbi:hypothetical protein FRAAL3749 [Frankia alni ACN14a]|uniref:Uncharacterized protein n=1 Tax=Frankia alni (strain DSM 45986 / CECT 9034 / ACN14a) TaxID=326424 RepID=Q0RJC0_FRAAA|nr:hypothetical protein FRAAL3749 [Frankia alni ACN14a]
MPCIPSTSRPAAHTAGRTARFRARCHVRAGPGPGRAGRTGVGAAGCRGGAGRGHAHPCPSRRVTVGWSWAAARRARLAPAGPLRVPELGFDVGYAASRPRRRSYRCVAGSVDDVTVGTLPRPRGGLYRGSTNSTPPPRCPFGTFLLL